jgi:hypothetical protein
MHIALARKGGVPKERVLYAVRLAQVRQHLKRRRQRSPNEVV